MWIKGSFYLLHKDINNLWWEIIKILLIENYYKSTCFWIYASKLKLYKYSKKYICQTCYLDILNAS